MKSMKGGLLSKERVGLSTESGDVRNVRTSGAWLGIEIVRKGDSEDLRDVERRRPSR